MKKVSSSRYLQKMRPVMKNLLGTLKQEFAYASVLAVDAESANYQISRRGKFLNEDAGLSGRGFVVRVYDGTGYAEYSFNELSEELIPEITERLKENLAAAPQELRSHYEQFPEDEISFAKSTEYEISPEEMGEEVILSKLERLREKALSMDERLTDFGIMANYRIYHKIFLSEKKDLEQNIMFSCAHMSAMARTENEMKTYFSSCSLLGGLELLDQMEGDIEKTVHSVLELLEAKPMVPGEYDCICMPDVTGMIAHEAFGHGVEMDMFVKDRALAKEYMGRQVASELVVMHDGAATAAEDVATYFFDDEGMPAKDTIVIDHGILKSGICDLLSALALKTEPTGNGRRESFERKAYTRMTNTYFEPGKDRLEDMIASIKYGFILENATSGMEDPKNWGIQCMVNMAREIRDGKLTGVIYSPIVLTGYVPDLLQSITMVSDGMELCGGGFCGKGYKEWVKVSTGGASIKARIRLG